MKSQQHTLYIYIYIQYLYFKIKSPIHFCTLKYFKARRFVLASALTIELADDNRCEEVFCLNTAADATVLSFLQPSV